MSIATRTGDNGTTGLMYNRRVPKHHDRVEAYGAVDELNAALGLARATSGLACPFVTDALFVIQTDLVTLMGELATLKEDLPRYIKDGFAVVTPAMTEKLDVWVKEIEAKDITFRGWATPGSCVLSATLDLARTTCRRAERRISLSRELGGNENDAILVYLNRLSDLLWLFARWIDQS